MADKVDVVMAMETAAKRLRLGVEGPRTADALDDARAAVAELIEATASYSAARGMKPVHVVNAKLSRVRAALARIGAA